MIELSRKLSAITKEADSDTLAEAKKIISELRRANMRHNNPKLEDFLTERQRELFYS
ncbi:MAG: hypothetical protein SVZ03_05765 [Spirochaetota bacterium]|nr:hypothetical protein [Spirochaetota bacterium]